ncbi:MAG TPA: hypothetical protein VGO90_14890 [Chthoniobacteraceae bacterium]|nr:hypothetical protein [Chthoniobacteraceae bacterium]
MIRVLLLASVAVVFSSCATFTETELAHVRSRGVSRPVLSKLDQGRPIEPADVIELTRRGIPERLILRQIEDHGVTSLIAKTDVLAMRRAGVSALVIDAVLRASDEFAGDYSGRGPDVSIGYTSYYDDWPGGYGYDPYYYDRPYYGSVGIGFSTHRALRPGLPHHRLLRRGIR